MANALLIEKQNGGYFKFTLNGDTANAITSIQNDLLAVGGQLHFKTGNGANIIKEQSIYPADLTIIAAGTFTFTTVAAVWNKLIDIGYFDWLGGGVGGVDRFDELLDTFQYTGNAGKAVIVDDSELKLVPITLYNKRLFTELEDVPNDLVPDKMVVVNSAGTALILKDQPEPPEEYLNSVGYFDYNDLATQTTPLNAVANVALKLTNDTEGANTSTDQNPYGVSYVWDYITNQFNFSELEVGDTIDVRVHLQVTTTTSNQKVLMSAKFGIGSVSEFTNSIYENQFKSSGTHEVSFVAPFYMGSTDITDYPAELYLTTDASATVKVDGWYVRILRKNINIITVDYQVPDATNLAKGIVRLAGDLGGNANNPTVPELANKVPTSRTISTTSPLTGGGALSSNLALGINQANSVQSGFVTFADWTRFDEAHNDRIVSAAVTGTTTKTLKLNQHDGGFIEANWSDDNSVTSVFGRTGAVVAVSGDYTTSLVTEGSNLYYTEARVSANTDVAANTAKRHDAVTIGIPSNGLALADQVLSLGLSSATTNGALSSTDWTRFDGKQGALTFTSPLVNTAGVVSIPVANTTVDGYLSGADWTRFDNKQPALIGVGFVKISGTTISYDNSTYVPTSRTITINGTGFDLSDNRTFNVGTVTSVAALTLGTTGTDVSSSVANGTTTPVITLNIPTSSATNRGALSSTDWTTFNNKQNAIAHLEFNNTNKTIWNNGNGNVASNTSFGDGALASNTTEIGNTAFGYNSLSSNSTGASNNTAFGTYSMQSNVSGYSNTAIGSFSMRYLTSGIGNIAIGQSAGAYSGFLSTNCTQSNTSIFIGGLSKPSSDNEENQIVIGYEALGAGSNSVVLGNDSITKTILKGNVGIGTTSPATLFQVKGNGNNMISLQYTSDGGAAGYGFYNSSGTELWSIGGGRFVSQDALEISRQGSLKFLINSSGNVGIGTTSPSLKLVVDSGSGSYTTIWAKSSFSASSKYYASLIAGYALAGNQSTQFGYIYDSATPTNSFAHITPWGSVEGSKFMVRADGNVGIGTTSPAEKLSVKAADAAIKLEGATNSYLFQIVDSNNRLRIFDNTNNTERITLTSGGNVGIGTTSPSYKLDVNGTLGVSNVVRSLSTSNAGIEFGNSGSGGEFGFLKWDNASNYLYLGHSYGGVFNKNFVINSSGNVGIGTTSPSQKLHIGGVGSAIAFDTTGASGTSLIQTVADFELSIKNNRGTSSEIRVGNESLNFYTNSVQRINVDLNGEVVLGSYSQTNNKVLDFRTNANLFTVVTSATAAAGTTIYYSWANGGQGPLKFNNASSEVMRLTGSGRVFINTTTGVGEDLFSIGFNSSTALNQAINIKDTNASANGAAYIVFRKSDDGGIGSITRIGTTSAVSYNTTSDYRLKEDFKQIKGLDLVSKIKVYDFKWKDNDARMDGVIAHELQKVVPYAVTGQKDGKEFQSVDYSKLVPILVQAIQELKAEIEILKTK